MARPIVCCSGFAPKLLPEDQIHVQKAVVVEISEIGPHCGQDHVEAGFPRFVLKELALLVVVESSAVRASRVWVPEPPARRARCAAP
jgi:hypothetical protein